MSLVWKARSPQRSQSAPRIRHSRELQETDGFCDSPKTGHKLSSLWAL
jgi:hypothetical protein